MINIKNINRVKTNNPTIVARRFLKNFISDYSYFFTIISFDGYLKKYISIFEFLKG